MADTNQGDSGEESEPTPLHVLPSEDDALAEAHQRAKDNETRLRKVSSAYKQLQSEMTALKARHERQKDLDQRLMKAKVVQSLFEPLQNLRRSVDAMEKRGVDPEVFEGIQLVGRSFLEAFESIGLEKVPGKGSIFSPDCHEAIAVVPVAIEAGDGRIVDVFAEGYRIGETLIQPAKVVIGKYTPPVEEDESGEE